MTKKLILQQCMWHIKITFHSPSASIAWCLSPFLPTLSFVVISTTSIRFTSEPFTKSTCTSGKWAEAPFPFLWPPVASRHERERWGLEVAVTSFLVCATCSKFATKCLSSVELTGEKWALSEPWPGCHEMTGIIGIHFKQPCAILLKCHIPTLKQTRRNPLW